MKTQMMVLFFIFSTLALSAQKIEKNEIDDFTGDRLIETKWDRLNMGNGITGKNHLYFKIVNINKEEGLALKWVTDEYFEVESESTLLLLQKDKTVEELLSVGNSYAEKGGGATGLQMSAILGLTLIYSGDLSFLEDDNNPVTKLRIDTNKGYVDINIKDTNAKKLNKAYKLVKQELNK